MIIIECDKSENGGIIGLGCRNNLIIIEYDKSENGVYGYTSTTLDTRILDSMDDSRSFYVNTPHMYLKNELT